MITRRGMVAGSGGLIAIAAAGSAAAQTPTVTTQGYVQVAEIEIDPAQLEDYKAAVKEQVETAIRVEPGVLALHAVAETDNPIRVRVFEIYRDTDAYKSHLESAHFKKYKAATEKMIKSLKLVQTTPIILGAKAR